MYKTASLFYHFLHSKQKLTPTSFKIYGIKSNGPCFGEKSIGFQILQLTTDPIRGSNTPSILSQCVIDTF